MSKKESGSNPFNIKQQIDQIASSLQSTFEASQRELCDAHAAEVSALREALAACEQSCADQKLRYTRLETAVDVRSGKLARAFYVWRSFGRQVFSSWRRITSLRKERASILGKLAIRMDRCRLSSSLAHWSKIAESISILKGKRIKEEKVKAVLKEVMFEYEEEVRRLEKKLHAAELEVRQGIAERKRLEEKTKVLLLRGMTAMNLDALQLFSSDSGGNDDSGDGHSDSQGKS